MGDSERSGEKPRLDELGQAPAAAVNLSCSSPGLSSLDEHWARCSSVAQVFSLCTFAFVRRVTGLKAVHGVFALKSQVASEIDLARQRRDGYQPRATPWEF